MKGFDWVRKLPDPRIGLVEARRRRDAAWAEIQRLERVYAERAATGGGPP